MFGRGSTDDKGPVLGWLNVLQWHSENKQELPVNIKFCFEGMEESGSNGLDELVEREVKKGGWFEDVDCVCIVSLTRLFRVYSVDDHPLDSLTTTGSTLAPPSSPTTYAGFLTSKSPYLDLPGISTLACSAAPSTSP